MAKDYIFTKLKSAGSAYTGKSVSSKSIDKVKSRNVYMVLLFLISTALLILGMVIVYSAVQNNEEYAFSKQVIGIVIGIVLMLVF